MILNIFNAEIARKLLTTFYNPQRYSARILRVKMADFNKEAH
jgi:hypothetical protein